MGDVGLAWVDWDEDVDDLVRHLAGSRTGEAGEAEIAAPAAASDL